MPGLLDIESDCTKHRAQNTKLLTDTQVIQGKKIRHQQQQKSGLLLTIAKEIGKQTTKHKAQLTGSLQDRAVPQ